MATHHPHDNLLTALDHHVSHVHKIRHAAVTKAAEHQAELEREQTARKTASQ